MILPGLNAGKRNLIMGDLAQLSEGSKFPQYCWWVCRAQ